MIEHKKKKGLLLIEQVAFEDLLNRKVTKNNQTSGKITLPTDWIGKQVAVVLVRGK